MKHIRPILSIAFAAVVVAVTCFSASCVPDEQAGVRSEPATVPIAVPVTQVESGDGSPGEDAAAAAEAAIRQRVQELTEAVESMTATGKDKTKDLRDYLVGSSEQQRLVTDDYRARWSGDAGGDTTLVVPGTLSIVRIVLEPDLKTAAVVTAATVRSAGDETGRCVESTVWVEEGGTWRRACYKHAYRHASSGVLPLEQGTEIDGMTWDLVRVEELSAATTAQGGDSLVVATVIVTNMAVDLRSPGGHTIVLQTPDGTRHEVSSASATLLPGMQGLLKTPLQGKEQRSLSLAFELPRQTDLAGLRYEIAKTGEAASGERADEPTYLQPGSPQAWALATSAMLSPTQDYRYDLLTGLPANAGNAEWCKSMLERWWGVGSRADLLDVLAWLKNDGHRKEWDGLAVYVSSLNDDEFRRFYGTLDQNQAHSVDMVQQYGAQLGATSILGFDLCRYVAVTREGCLCGYITEDEAWERIMPAAAKLQAAFSSWEALADNYLLGREFWSYEQTLIDGADRRAWIDILLTDPWSPWILNPWNLDLGVGTAGGA